MDRIRPPRRRGATEGTAETTPVPHPPIRRAATLLLGIVVFGLAVLPIPADGQILKKLRETAQRAAEEETLDTIDELIRDGVRCVFDDLECIRDAGDDVVLTDSSGQPVTDDEGNLIDDPDEAASTMASRTPLPGEGAWANYDFVPGDRILFFDDYSEDRVGDFPRGLEFVSGNWEVVEWGGRRLLRNTGPRHSTVRIRLPEALPETFTIEIEAYLPQSNQVLALFTEETRGLGNFQGQYFGIAGTHTTGVLGRGEGTVESANRAPRLHEGLIPIRFMVDGRYVKAYVEDRRVANAPNVTLVRSDVIQIENAYDATDENPILLGDIRIAAGGRDLYDVLAEKGRVATRGITFAVNSDRIRPESTGTLREVGLMLEEHPELRVSIEGHTDSDGDEELNLDLSARRAAAVRDYLLNTYDIEDERLETQGFGEGAPVASNATAAGKAENRRVELVRLNDPG